MLLEYYSPVAVFEELRFIIELIAAELIFVLPNSKKRSRFFFRFCISTALILALSLVYPALTYYLNLADISTVLYYGIIVTWYCCLVLLTVVYQLILFDFGFEQAILHAVSGYAIMHIEYAVVNEFLALTVCPFLGNGEHLLLYICICIVSYSLVLAFAYFVLFRDFHNLTSIYMPNKKLSVLFYLILLVFTIFLCFAGQSIYRGSDVLSPNYLGLAVELMTCMLVLFVQYFLYSENKRKFEIDIVNQLLYENARQYELKKESITLINQKCHDMKHQLAALSSMSVADKEDTIKKLYDEINIYDSSLNTNNEVLDILLMEKQLLCINKGIRLTFFGDGALLKSVSTTDLYTLFGNALDNAIEAVTDIDNKVIDVTISNYKGTVIISISNYFRGNIEMENGKPKTSKKDSRYHGFGISSISTVVKKYNGIMNIDINNSIFKIKILLPL